MSTSAQAVKSKAEIPRISPRIVSLFAAYTRRYLRRHFHAFRILKTGLPPADATRPLVIYLNHAAWWDPLVCLLLAREYFPERASFAPIDAAMLERYRFFKHLGFFGVDAQRPGGSLRFMRTARAILATSEGRSHGNILWITPQGRFQDVRERPIRFQEGLGTLAARESGAAFLPLAIEYSFWTEPRPEILVSFGREIAPELAPARDVAEWTPTLSAALEDAQDQVALHSCRRDASDWLVINRSTPSVSVVYDCWRSLQARLLGERFTPEHQPENML